MQQFLTCARVLFYPERFQGWGKERSYFEGWYFKLLDQSGTHAFAFIPGVAMDENGKQQAFIQILDGKKRSSEYIKFPFEAFSAAKDRLFVKIGENTFSQESITLNLPEIKGTLRFKSCVAWPRHWYSPGIMGPFTFIPFMECYHGIVSLDHAVSGELQIGGDVINFDNGRGYTEKDWGRSFPSSYVWMQSNHFSSPGISLKVSVAKIPWAGRSFVGFIAGLWLHDHLIKFTTYNRSKLAKLEVDSGKIEIKLENSRHHLKIIAFRDAGTPLASPLRGFMDGRVEESMSSTLYITLTEKKSGRLLLYDTGQHAALEVFGDVENELVPHKVPRQLF